VIRAWSSLRARITEVSHFLITAGLQRSGRPGVLMPGFHGRPKCSNWKMTDHVTYFPHIVRDRAWSSLRARITEVSHFLITAGLQRSGRPGVLMICRSLGMSSDQLERSGLNGSPVRTQLSRRMRSDCWRAWLLSMASLPSDLAAWAGASGERSLSRTSRL
jgi:hypothetical protein